MTHTDASPRPSVVGARRFGDTACSVAQWLSAYARRHPVSIGFCAIVAVVSTVTQIWPGDIADGLASGPLSTLQLGRWWTPVTSLVVEDSALGTLMAVALGLTVLALAERLLGSRRTLVVMLLTGVSAMILGSLVETALSAIPAIEQIDPLDSPVLDPLVAVVGALTAASALASALWRRRIRLAVFSVVGMFVLYYGDADAWYQAAAAVIGLLAGRWIVRDRPHVPHQRSSTRETRSLVALAVAVTGLGPTAAILGGGGRGPLSLAVAEFTQFDAGLIQRCETAYLPLCDHQIALLVTRGAGPALLAAVPLVLLVVAAWGLRVGRRAAWVLTVVVNASLATLAIVSLWLGSALVDAAPGGSVVEWVLWTISSIGVPVATIVVLWMLRRRFGIRAPRRAAVGLVVTVGVASACCIVGFLVIESIFSRAFTVHPTAADALAEAVSRFIPPAFLDAAAQPPYPRGGPALVAYQWIGVAFWAVVVTAILRLYRRTMAVPGRADRDVLYQSLLRRGGGGTLGFLGTWQGNEHWYSDDLQAAIPYRVIGGVALAVADPVCPPALAGSAIRAFTEFGIHHGWTPVFYSIHEEYLSIFAQMGWRWVSVGEETVMRLTGLELSGRAWQKIRHPLSRAERDGMRAVWTRWSQLTPVMRTQIIEISERWVAEKSLPEMGFTLGSLDELRDPAVELMLAVDAGDRVQAVTSWLPSWRDGVVTGWTLDFMRRRDDAPNGVMEFVIAKAALRLRDEGIELLSLSGAPLASKPRDATGADADRTALDGVLDWLASALEPVYGFSSLLSFKSKFHPEYRTLYLAYADPATLPLVGSAIARAYLPEASSREYLALVRTMLGASR